MTAATGGDGRGAALITGASAGIGRALATEFASHGHDVVLVARREGRLSDLADELASGHGVTATPVAMDLSDPDAPARLLDEVAARDVPLGTLVNNVGVGTHGRFAENDREREKTQLALNVEVLVELTHRFLRGRERGGVLNVGSLAGFTPGPYMAGYYASKAYVNSFSQALAAEYRNHDVTVTVVCPGPVATEFHERAGVDPSSIGALVTYSPEYVARAAYAGLRDGDAVVIPGWRMKLLYGLSRVVPARLRRIGGRWVNRGR